MKSNLIGHGEKDHLLKQAKIDFYNGFRRIKILLDEETNIRLFSDTTSLFDSAETSCSFLCGAIESWLRGKNEE